MPRSWIAKSKDYQLDRTYLAIFPYSTLPFTLHVKPSIDGHFLEVSGDRQLMPAFYNRYIRKEFSLGKNEAWNSILNGQFGTGQALNQYVLNWDASRGIHPLAPGAGPWEDGDANIEDALVFIFAAGGKTALAFAYALKYQRPEKKPAAVVGIASDRSRGMAVGTNYYDAVLSYEALEDARAMIKGRKTKILIADFGGRGNAADTWFSNLQVEVDEKIAHLCIAAVPKEETRGQQVSVPHIRAAAIDMIGEKEYFKSLDRDWETFREQVDSLGLRLVWKRGVEEFAKDWAVFTDGRSDPSVGYLYIF